MVGSSRYSLVSIKISSVYNLFHMFQPSVKDQGLLQLDKGSLYSRLFQDVKKFAITCSIYII